MKSPILEMVECRPSLLHRALLMTRHKEDAEDLVQDVYEHAFRLIGEYKEEGKMFGWLATIMYYRWNNRLRILNAQKRIPREAFCEFDDELYCQIPEEEGFSDRIYVALSRLSERQQIVLLLRYIDLYTIDEVKKLLGVKYRDITNWTFEGKKRLRKILQKGIE